MHSYYRAISCAHLFEVHIKIKFRVLLTPSRVRRILMWVSEYVEDATKITISTFWASDEAISLFKLMHIEVENMPQLQYVCLRCINMDEEKTSIVVRNTSNKEDIETKHVFAIRKRASDTFSKSQ